MADTSENTIPPLLATFPAENPKVQLHDRIDSPKGFRQYGSNVAAPVFKEIADKIYAVGPGIARFILCPMPCQHQGMCFL
jgi:hypothetical protein